MMTTPNETKETVETIFDGTVQPIEFKDGSKSTIKVRKVPMLKMGLMAQNVGTEEKELCFYLDVDSKFLTTVTDESLEVLLLEGRRLNFPQFQRYTARQQQVTEVVNGQFNQQQKELLERLSLQIFKDREKETGQSPS